MRQVTESIWPQGWIPSASDKGDPKGLGSTGLLRMDNLTQDEQGLIRMAQPPKLECTNQFPASDIYSIFSAILNGIKVRFVYISSGITNKVIMCTTTNPRNFSTTLITQAETVQRCEFLNALGQIIMIAGGIQRKYDGTNNFTLGIPAPSPPTLLSNATVTVSLNNYDGSSHYTNWAGIAGLYNTIDVSGATIFGTPAIKFGNNSFVFQTIYGGTLDTTNLGGTGLQTDNDIFTFSFKIDDATKLSWVRIELLCEDPTSFTAQNYYYQEWNFQSGRDIGSIFGPFTLASKFTTVVQLLRKDWFRTGDDPTKDWTNIKAIRVNIGTNGDGSETITWSAFSVKGGAQSTLDGVLNYRAVQVNNTGGYIQFSPMSTAISVTTSVGNVTVTPADAVDSQCNEYWLFRQDVNGGNYYLVNKQAGARGFSPAAYLDYRPLSDLLTDAAINSLYTLQYYRTALPTNIIGVLWFRDRVIYLTTKGFIPSYKLDPGSYDSRFVYEIVGSITETCLFAAKLDVGTFVVATTRDFYRITGTFNTLFDPNDTTGTVQYQDVVITPLGVSDPAISHAFVEYEGTIMYASATGIRLLTNATSTLINGNLELLFRDESRFDLSPIKLLPNDGAVIAAISKGTRIYWLLPCLDGINRIFTMITGENRGWRLYTFGETEYNPRSLCREEDGTILCGFYAAPSNYIRSLEEGDITGFLPIKFRTPFNYLGGVNRKDMLCFKMKVNTNSQPASLVILGLQYDGSVKRTTVEFTSQGDSIMCLDIMEQTLNTYPFKIGIPPAIAYAVEIASVTNGFILSWIQYTVEDRPTGTRRVVLYPTSMDKSGRKRLAEWPFIADPLGLLSNAPTNITAMVKADGVLQPLQTFTGSDVTTFKWKAPITNLMATDWGIEVFGDEEFEFHKFLAPVIIEETPPLTMKAVVASSNFGYDGRKRMGSWPFRVNLRGSTINVTVKADVNTLPVATITGTDIIDTLRFIPPDDTLAVDWAITIDVTAGVGMEFYEFQDPIFTEKKPRLINQAIMPTTNFGSSNRKRFATLPILLNPLGKPFTMICRTDGIEQTAVIETPANPDEIMTAEYIPHKDLLAVDWQLKINCDTGMEFYEFLKPNVAESYPNQTKHAIQPYTNFGRSGPKKISVWPFQANPLGQSLRVLCSIDGIAQPQQIVIGNLLGTYFWYNKRDVWGVDYKLEVYTEPTNDQGELFEFYKFFPPELLQVFPVAKYFDQIGPLDFNAEGLVYGIRARLMGLGPISYIIYDADIAVFSDSITTTMVDQVYIIKFPKGIIPAVCRLILSSGNIFYRFSIEYHVRTTGKETEGKYIKVSDVGAK